jgi:nitrite reductase/ring-hydroxylating ferredoxin subunit
MPKLHLKLHEIPEEKPFRVDCDHTPIVIVRTGQEVKAFYDICPHAYWHLSDGEYRNGVLECPGHGWEFSTTSGECSTVPAYCLTQLGVVRDGEYVHVEWDEASLVGKERAKSR